MELDKDDARNHIDAKNQDKENDGKKWHKQHIPVQ
jgi:hypothetical protein